MLAIKRIHQTIISVAMTLLLSACGGGSGSAPAEGTNTPVPVVTPTALNKVKEIIAGQQDISISATELNSIEGVNGAVPGTDYIVALRNGQYKDRSKPTSAEIQAIIDAVNNPPINHRPTITATPNTTILKNENYSFSPVANDSDGDTLVFSIKNKPTWATFDTATGKLSGTPSNADVGTTLGIVISVSDGTDVAELNPFNITVKETNNAPTIGGTPSATINADSLYSFTPSANDSDGDTLVFSIKNKPTWATFDTATGKLSGTPTNADVGTTSGIVISVSDKKETVSLASFNLTVKLTNHIPTISETPSTTINADSLYSFTPSANDSDKDTLVFSIKNKPTWATFDTATGKLSGTPTNADVGTTSGIVISVSDGTESVALSVFDLEVLYHVVSCGNSSDKGYSVATEVVTGKRIKGTSANVRLWHTADGKRKICIIGGKVKVQ